MAFDVISISAAISACEKGGEWQQGLSLFNQPCKDGLSFDMISSTAAISACEKGAQWQHALRLLLQGLRISRQAGRARERARPYGGVAAARGAGGRSR